MGIAGIIIAVALFILLVYRGWRNLYIAPICVVIVCLFNQMNPVEAVLGSFINGVLEMCGIVFVVIFMGVILGRVYTDTGASLSIAHFFIKNIVDKQKGNRKIIATIVCYYIISSVLVLGGIDTYAIMFTTLPVCVVMFKNAGMPRRFIPAMLLMTAGVCSAPGTPGIANVIPQQAFAGLGIEWSITSALVPGIITTLAISVLSCLFMYLMTVRAIKRGETFELGEVENYELDTSRKLPHFVLAIIPLVVIYVLFAVVGLELIVAETGGILVALLLMGRYMERPSLGFKSWLGTLKRTLNTGVGYFPDAVFNVSVTAGLAGVITSTAAFGLIAAALGGIPVHPVLLTFIVIGILVAITSSPPVALMVGLPIIVQSLIAKGIPFSAEAVGRVAAYSITTFETLPISGAILMTLSLVKLNHREGYPPQFVITVVVTTIGTLLCGLLCVLFGV